MLVPFQSPPGIIKPAPWATVINWAHPLTRGLQFAVLWGVNPGNEYVRGYPGTTFRNVSTNQIIGEQGFGAGRTFNPSTGCGVQFGATTSDTLYLGDITIVFRGQYQSGGGNNNFLNKANSSATTAAPFILWDASNVGSLNLYRAGASARDTFGTGAGFVTNNVVGSYGATCSGTNGGACVMYKFLNGAFTATTIGTTVANAPYTGSSQAIASGSDVPSFNTSTTGTILCAYIWNRILTTGEMFLILSRPYTFFSPSNFVGRVAAASSVAFRRTLSTLGTRSGSRQIRAFS